MAIVISGEVDLDPAKRTEALIGAAPLIDLALAEPGCRHYAWTASPRDPGRVHVFEEWESAETLAAHLVGPAYRGMLAHLQGFGILAAVTRKYRVDLIEPVYGPDGVATAEFLTANDG
jgi:quinol monooxygenase YgiN